MSVIKRIRRAVHAQRVQFTDHALDEMDNDDLTLEQIRTILVHGALYQVLLDDPRGVRYVVRGAVDDEDVDVVCRFLASGILLIIAVYIVSEIEEDSEDNNE